MNRTTHPPIALGLLLGGALFVTAGCQMNPARDSRELAPNLGAIDESLKPPATAPATPPPEVTAALLPPLQLSVPSPRAVEPRFDVAVNEMPARAFFMGLVEGTPYNVVVHPDVAGKLSLNLRNVTVDEVMQTLRDVYGYEFHRRGNLYQVMPARMRSRIFRIDYLNIQRIGASRTRVSSGQISGTGIGESGTESDTASDTESTGSSAGGTVSGSEVETRSEADFWHELTESLRMLIGEEGGRRVVVNPQAGIVVVRAMPGELRDVQHFLDTLQKVVARQVILEAKIIEVELNDGFQSGINWAAIGRPAKGETIQAGQTGAGNVFENGTSALVGSTAVLSPGTNVTSLATTALGGVFTLDLNLNDFNAFIELLKTQGKVQVLSSPRVATVNNQKAVIKVGTDEFFVTDIDTQTNTSGVSTLNQTVNVQLTPFFSGVALDVIPQIDDNGEVILHIHPTVSEVTEKTKEINVSTESTLSVPLALSSIRESDTIIRARSGQVVVIGGLMKELQRDEMAKTPALGDVPLLGKLFRHERRSRVKSELVILLRPIVTDGADTWSEALRSSAARVQSMDMAGH